MDLNQLIRRLCKDVENVDEYIKLLDEIKAYVRNDKKLKGKQVSFYFRGDCYCTPLQSRLFQSGDISRETKNFENWQENCPLRKRKDNICECEKNRGKYVCLAHMQHYNDQNRDNQYDWRTRLLDFSKCPFVALRFACGDKDNCRKKVTVFITADPIEICDSDRVGKLMDMVNCSSDKEFAKLYADDYAGYLKKDIFVEIPSDAERVKRQKALTLFMGNLTTYELLSQKPDPESQAAKVIHQLNQNIGRGKSTYGYIATIGISAKKVSDIRSNLEQCQWLRMDYLLQDDSCRSAQ